jgi:hypothetical protein
MGTPILDAMDPISKQYKESVISRGLCCGYDTTVHSRQRIVHTDDTSSTRHLRYDSLEKEDGSVESRPHHSVNALFRFFHQRSSRASHGIVD